MMKKRKKRRGLKSSFKKGGGNWNFPRILFLLVVILVSLWFVGVVGAQWYNPDLPLNKTLYGIDYAHIIPNRPNITSNLTCANGSMGSEVTNLYYKWYKNNQMIEGVSRKTLNSGNFSIGDNLTCTIIASNMTNNWSKANSSERLLIDSSQEDFSHGASSNISIKNSLKLGTDSNGLYYQNGTYTSRIFDLGTVDSNLSLSWKENYTYGKELKNDSATLMLCRFNRDYICENGQVASYNGTHFMDSLNYKGVYVGTDDNLSFPINKDNFNKSLGTVEMWVRPVWSPGASSHAFFRAYYNNTNKMKVYYSGSTDRIYYAIYSNGEVDWDLHSNISHWNPNEWHHIAFTWNDSGAGSSTAKMYLDGQIVVNKSSLTLTLHGTPGRLWIGSLYGGPTSAKSLIDELRISNKIRNSTEIYNSFKRGVSNVKLQYKTSVDNITWTNWMSGEGVPILGYHVINQSGSYNINATAFEEQMAWLNSSGYTTITAAEYYNYTQRLFDLPDYPIIITFDDGRQSQYDVARPIMDKYGFKGVAYVITDYASGLIGSKDDYMNWANINDLQDKYGWEIGSHSVNHSKLSLLSKSQVIVQANDSKTAITANTNVTPITFAYPNGASNPSTDMIVDDYYNLAVADKGMNLKNSPNLYNVRRIWPYNVSLNEFKRLVRGSNLTDNDYSSCFHKRKNNTIFLNSNQKYIRYRAVLSSINTNETPTLPSVTFKQDNYYTTIQGICGDGICHSKENCTSCSEDCGECPATTTEEDTTTSGGGGGYPTFKPTKEQLQKGYEKSLRKNWKVNFGFNNKSHTLKLDNIINKTAVITISSEPVTFNLTINETKKLNLDDDNYYDLQVFLKDISDYKADLIVKLIHEEIPDEKKEGVEKEKKREPKKIEEKLKLWLLILGLSVVIIAMILIVRYKKKRK